LKIVKFAVFATVLLIDCTDCKSVDLQLLFLTF